MEYTENLFKIERTYATPRRAAVFNPGRHCRLQPKAATQPLTTRVQNTLHPTHHSITPSLYKLLTINYQLLTINQ